MNLYMIRHGIAQPLGKKNDFRDEKRVLTSDGRDRMRASAKGLRKLGIEFDIILTSPLARANETAEIIAEALGVDKKQIHRTDNLKPGASAEELFSEIKKHKNAESIALVGHQPDLGELISRIAHGNTGLSLQVKKGGVCCINVKETVPALRGSLVWFFMPKQLRLLSKL